MKKLFFPRSLVVFCIASAVGAIGLSLAHQSTSSTSKSNKVTKTEDEWVSEQLKTLSTKEKIAQSFMVACWTNKGPKHTAEIQKEITENHIGGIIFFQGERTNLSEHIAYFQAQTTIPLLFGMDAEWGVAMRLSGEERFPFQQTIGQANDLDLTEQIGEQMGIECQQFGIHLSFSPDADISLNPKNPVIGFRSFGSEAQVVAQHTAAFVKGMERTGTLSCVKHFPGHGDTDKDSHLELPTVSHSEAQFRSSDFVPFKQGIAAGTRAIMVAHLNVPNLDPSGTPSSLSKKVIKEYLRKELNFNGLVISDALNMKAVADKYGTAEVVAKAYEAGCDILLFPESVKEAIELIEQRVQAGTIALKDVNQTCERILRAKYKSIIAAPVVKRKNPTPDRYLAINKVFEKAIVVLKNDHAVLPVNQLNRKIIRIGVGPASYDFTNRLADYTPFENHYYFTPEEAIERLKSVKIQKQDLVLVDYHAPGQRAKNNYGFGNWKALLGVLPVENDVVVTFFGNQQFLADEKSFGDHVDAVILAPENHSMMQERTAQFVMGAFDVENNLQTAINQHWKKGDGLVVKGNGRLKFTIPEEIGVSSSQLNKIDDIVNEGIQAKAFPGCQIVVAIEGKVIYRKSFGTTKYEEGDTITNDHIYDIASITKIASSTMALMKLKSEGKFDVQATLGELTPEYVKGTPYAFLKAIDLLTHQAGLTPWIPFYKKTIENGALDQSIYSSEKKAGFERQVANGIYIKSDYWKTILERIVATPLSGQKKYEYSDLSYYFFKAFIEKQTGMTLDQYVQQAIYAPLGLQTMTYLPLMKFPLARIVPTENDKEFRNQLIHGFVHDPGAAMMGGVAGHAGLFSSATDLAKLMQVLLNEGKIGTYTLIKPEVVNQFTACQFSPTNRRGIGFDKPTISRKDGPTSDYASSKTFGHSGFTGTITWADPEYKINYVFLSNRVYPDASNKKITNMSIRNRIHDVIYEAVLAAKKNK